MRAALVACVIAVGGLASMHARADDKSETTRTARLYVERIVASNDASVWAAVVRGGKVRVRQQARFEELVFGSDVSAVSELRFVPGTDECVLVISGHDNRAKPRTEVRRLSDGTDVSRLDPPIDKRAASYREISDSVVVLSRNGTRMARIRGPRTIELRNAASGEAEKTLTTPDDIVRVLGLAATGDVLVLLKSGDVAWVESASGNVRWKRRLPYDPKPDAADVAPISDDDVFVCAAHIIEGRDCVLFDLAGRTGSRIARWRSMVAVSASKGQESWRREVAGSDIVATIPALRGVGVAGVRSDLQLYSTTDGQPTTTIAFDGALVTAIDFGVDARFGWIGTSKGEVWRLLLPSR